MTEPTGTEPEQPDAAGPFERAHPPELGEPALPASTDDADGGDTADRPPPLRREDYEPL